MYKFFFKRFLDIILSLLIILVFSPVYIIIAVCVRIWMGSPILFSQERIGKDEKIFKMYKFRSMTDERDENVDLLPDEVRLTKFGKLLRSTSLDELPELWNILKGDMALIGPRPALTYHPWPYDQYTEHQKHMFDVLPGVTGWAQVNGRKEVPWPERIELNVWYAQHMSLWLDIKIFFMTIFKVATNANNENVGETGVKK